MTNINMTSFSGGYGFIICISTIFFTLLYCQHVVATQPKVNLIHPTFEGARIDNCLPYSPGKEVVCNYTLWTRAAEYKVLDVDVIGGKTGKIVRASNWVQPTTQFNSEFYIDNGRKRLFSSHRNTSNILVVEQKSTEKFHKRQPSDMWMMCGAYASFNLPSNSSNSSYYAMCFREAKLYVCKQDDPTQFRCTTRSVMKPIQLKGKGYPITAAAAKYFGKTDDRNEYNLHIILLDASGTLHFEYAKVETTETEVELQFNTPGKPVLLSSVGILKGNIPAPLWMTNNNILKNDLKSKITENYDTKMRGVYIQTITPLLLKYPLKNNDIDNTKIVFCMSNQLNVQTDDNVTLFNCTRDGDDLTRYAGSYRSSKSGTISLLAHHIVSYKGSRYTHLVYRLYRVEGVFTRYVWSQRIGEYNTSNVPNNGLAEYNIDESGIKQIQDEQYIFEDISLPPTDIVGFQYKKCLKTVGLYDDMYTIGDLDKSLVDEGEMQLFEDLDIKYNAAFAYGNKFFFFTHSNVLIEISATMDDGCSTISLKMNTKKERFSQDFIFHHTLKSIGNSSIDGYRVVDYREYEENALDTKPPINAINPPTPNSSSGVSVIVIAACVVVGGLIIAGIVYMCCIRGNDANESRRMRRPKTPVAPINIDSELGVKTVRSSVKTPSEGPMMMRSNVHKSAVSGAATISGSGGGNAIESQKAKSLSSTTTVKVTKGQNGTSTFKAANSPLRGKSKKTKRKSDKSKHAQANKSKLSTGSKSPMASSNKSKVSSKLTSKKSKVKK